MMKQVICRAFGGPENIVVEDVAIPEPGPGQVRVRMTSVGMNYADLMARRGEYKRLSGDPPFVFGIEGAGVIDAVGEGVEGIEGDMAKVGGNVGGRVVLDIFATGTYTEYYVCDAAHVVPVPDGFAELVGEDEMGAIWLTYLTAWGCLIGKQNIQAGQLVALPAASSGVALAAAQIVKRAGGIAIGLTTSAKKVEALHGLATCRYDHLVLTRGPDGNPTPWHKDLKRIANEYGRSGIDVFFDPVAAGAYLEAEIRCLADGGTVWIYGLLGTVGKVNVFPLIIKNASLRGYVNGELRENPETMARGQEEVFAGFLAGDYTQHIAQKFSLDQAQAAQETLERGDHVGKMVIVP